MRNGRILLYFGLYAALFVQSGLCEFQPLTQYVIDQCDTQPWTRRIYSYDFGVDQHGVVHAVYSKPNEPNYTNDSIIYAYGSPTNMTKVVLCDNGTHSSISTFLQVDTNNGLIHVCYNMGQEAGAESLMYQIISNNIVYPARTIDPHAWHSRMQLDEFGSPVFVRQDSNKLRIITKGIASPWITTDVTSGVYGTPRLADFVYDKERGVYHILYGDQLCGTTYDGAPYHRLWYLVSEDGGTNWTSELINDSCTLWENEFWVSLVLDDVGSPSVAMYKFNVLNGERNTGTSLLYYKKIKGVWTNQIIAGVMADGQPPAHRAGMGVQMASDRDRVFAVFDDSPDTPIDFDGKYGNIVLRYSRDGLQWDDLQQIAEFSAEGYCRVKISGPKLYIMALGDWHDTKVYFYSYLLNNLSILSNSVPLVGDFDGDGKAGYGIYYAPTGYWQIHRSRAGMWENNFGYDGTEPITGDFDGDGKLDFGCYFPPSGQWYIFKSTGGFWANNFGYEGTTPFTGDFDGDGIMDFGCYYPPSGAWYIFKSRGGFWSNSFGYDGTSPITGDFDGDGIGDFGCYYPPSGAWYIYRSHAGFYANHFGYGGTLPITGDFDGDGITDFGCYYPPSGHWYIYKSKGGFWSTQFGYTGTLPVAADFDGDGLCDFGCFAPDGGYWFLYCSRAGFRVEQSVVY